jgi:Restriction endonuclease
MTLLRIPSFNDFSVGLLNGDLRPVLAAVQRHSGDEVAIFNDLGTSVLAGWAIKRIQTNIPATLGNTGLTNGRPLKLSAFGQRVLSAPTPIEAAEIFCTEIIQSHNGSKLIEAIQALHKKGERATKFTLQSELAQLNVKLSNDTTDHTTLKNWMIAAKIVKEPRSGFPEIDDVNLKRLTGISSGEADEFQSLTLGQQTFLHLLRKLHITGTGPFQIQYLYSECKSIQPHAYGNANFASLVKDPLSAAGWIDVPKASGDGRGGKSGTVKGTAKLLSIPVERVIPNFDTTVPNDLRKKLQTPLSQIRDWLEGEDIHQGGLGLELLALRIILDLRLTPRGFRVRSRQTAFAEVDVTAEGDHLMFSRWTFQCKRIQATKNVSLGDVAKEVGIAMHMRAHVIVMVSTGGFTREAIVYAKEMTKASHLQFVFLDGRVIKAYLANGPTALYEHVMNNARHVMSEKRNQPIPGSDLRET